jgi:hypothetical protein
MNPAGPEVPTFLRDDRMPDPVGPPGDLYPSTPTTGYRHPTRVTPERFETSGKCDATMICSGLSSKDHMHPAAKPHGIAIPSHQFATPVKVRFNTCRRASASDSSAEESWGNLSAVPGVIAPCAADKPRLRRPARFAGCNTAMHRTYVQLSRSIVKTDLCTTQKPSSTNRNRVTHRGSATVAIRAIVPLGGHLGPRSATALVFATA